MEYFGLIAFILVMFSINKVEKVNKLEKKLKRLERKVKGDMMLPK